MARCTQITPFIPVADMERAIRFYENCLGFGGTHRMEDNYAFLRRDDVAIRLLKADCDVDLTAPEREIMIYIDVEDVDGLYATLEHALNDLPKGRVRAPFDQPYNQREFHVTDEDCTLILFGEGTK